MFEVSLTIITLFSPKSDKNENMRIVIKQEFTTENHSLIEGIKLHFR